MSAELAALAEPETWWAIIRAALSDDDEVARACRVALARGGVSLSYGDAERLAALFGAELALERRARRPA